VRLLVALILAGCGREPLTAEVHAVGAGIEVVASAPIERVEIAEVGGGPLAARTLPVPTREATVLAPWRPEAAYEARLVAGGEAITVPFDAPARGPLGVWLAAPVGQAPRPVADDDGIPVTLLGDGPVEAAVIVESRVGGRVVVSTPGDPVRVLDLPAPGMRGVVTFTLDAGAEVFGVMSGGEVVVAELIVERLPLDEARARLSVAATTLPADGRGRPDRSLPQDRIALPAPWWTALLRRFDLGWRARDDQAPWTFQAVTLRNDSEHDVSVAVSTRVEGDAGPVAAFRSRLRGAETVSGAVSALVRVPAHDEATAILPVFVEERTVEEGVYTRVIEVTPLGSAEPLHRIEAPLVVTQGSAWASGGFLAALGASLAGLVLLARRGPKWLAALDTPDLVTIALFGSLTFVVAAAARLVGYGVAAVLGPFAPLVTGLVDDAFRTCLLAALVALVPRPGVVTLASLVGYLMRGLALGSFHPADLLYFGSIVLFLEGCLWVAGLTRDTGWVDESPVRRWVRLSLGFGVANALAVASGLVVTVVLYRLFFADWYVAMMVALHGFLYVVLGCAFAVPFADRVRKVAS